MISFPLDGFTEIIDPNGHGNELASGAKWLGRAFLDSYRNGLTIRSHVTQRLVTFGFIGSIETFSSTSPKKDPINWVFALDTDVEVDVRVRVVRVVNDL